MVFKKIFTSFLIGSAFFATSFSDEHEKKPIVHPPFIVQKVDETFTWGNPHSEIKFLKCPTVEKVFELREMRLKNNNLHKDEKLSTGFINHWGYFIEKGVPLEILAEMPEASIFRPSMSEMYDEFIEGRYSESFLKRFKFDIPAYSREVAESQPNSEKGLEWTKKEIKRKL